MHAYGGQDVIQNAQIMSRWNIEILEKAAPDDMRLLISKLTEYNDAHRPAPYERKDIRLFLRNEAGEIVAGLIGGVSMNCLLIQILWVDESLRGEGLGRELITMAERIGQESGAHMAIVETTLFQAPEFYIKLGYKVICEIDGSPVGSKTLLMQRIF